MLLAFTPTYTHHKIPISRPFLPFLWNQTASPSFSSPQSRAPPEPSPSTNSLMASPALGAGTPPFLTKTYAMVDDPETDDTISWNESGTAFVVWRRAEFERDLLPKNFKHSNFASFVRQLNTYGFRKIGLDRWEFANECFRKGEKRLLGAIQRRKGSGAGAPAPAMMATPIATAIPISPTPTSSGGDPAVSSSPPPGLALVATGAMAELEEENARLRRENARLARELARARRVCDGVRHLVWRYDQDGEEVGVEDERHGGAGGKPMLFGVAIGSKRSREDRHEGGDEENGAEEDGEDDEEEQEHDDDDDDDERHAARREQGKSMRTERSDLNVLSLSVRAAAAARPDGGSRDR